MTNRINSAHFYLTPHMSDSSDNPTNQVEFQIRDAEPFVPLGDAPVAPGGYRTIQAPREDTNFNSNYVPLTCAARHARAWWLVQHRLYPMDAFTRVMLRRQEKQDEIIASGLATIFGKGSSDWRVMLAAEMRSGLIRARREFCARRTAAVNNDPDELARLNEAERIVDQAIKGGVARRAQLLAFDAVLRFHSLNRPMPPRDEVYQFLEACGIAVTPEFKRNAGREIFNIPLLRDCAVNKGGRPKKEVRLPATILTSRPAKPLFMRQKTFVPRKF